jgi:hypothetical protein
MLPDLRLRTLDRILDPPKCRHPPGLQHEVRSPRIAVARLPDRAGVQQPATRVELDDRFVRSDPSSEHVAFQADCKRHVAVSNEDKASGCRLERPPGRLLAENVLPNRISGAGVEQRDAVTAAARPELGEELPRVWLEHFLRPPCRRSRLPGEVVDRKRAEHDEVVVAREAHVRTSRDRAAALVGLRPVSDEVTEAPELVGLLVVDGREDGVERVPITVDV